MNKTLRNFGLASTVALALLLPGHASATDYNGNGNSDFDGAVGLGVLNFSVSGGTLTGTITNGNAGAGFNDTLVIYIDSQAGGFTTTSSFTDAGTLNASGVGTDNLRASISGFNGTQRAPLNFATGFGADYAIAIGPASAGFGAVFTLSSTTGFTYGSDGTNGNVNLTSLGNGKSATYTFSLPLSLIGSPASFNFAATYLNGGTAVDGSGNQSEPYRSGETYGTTIVDATNPTNTGSIGQDTGLVGFTTFAVPEPGTWAMMMLGGVGLLVVQRRRARRA